MSVPPLASLQRAVLARRIRRFIDRELLEEPSRGRDALADGAVDSLAIEQLIDHIEHTYDIHFADEELIAENFSSIEALVALVHAKCRGEGSSRAAYDADPA